MKKKVFLLIASFAMFVTFFTYVSVVFAEEPSSIRSQGSTSFFGVYEEVVPDPGPDPAPNPGPVTESTIEENDTGAKNNGNNIGVDLPKAGEVASKLLVPGLIMIAIAFFLIIFLKKKRKEEEHEK